jgi:hypothetical protein
LPVQYERFVEQLYKMLTDTAGRLGWPVSVGLGVGLTVLATLAGFATIVMLPADHFISAASPTPAHPIVRFALKVVKNIVGSVVILLGLVMMLPLVPGPGLVFLLLGLSLVDFPGKRAIELKLLMRPGVNRFINSLRLRYGKAPFLVQ